jgi:hypothetical protein
MLRRTGEHATLSTQQHAASLRRKDGNGKTLVCLTQQHNKQLPAAAADSALCREHTCSCCSTHSCAQQMTAPVLYWRQGQSHANRVHCCTLPSAFSADQTVKHQLTAAVKLSVALEVKARLCFTELSSYLCKIQQQAYTQTRATRPVQSNTC